MIADPWLQWALAVLFLVAAGYRLWPVVRPGPWLSRIGHSFHVLMCLSMLAMIWTSAPPVSYPAQVVVFAAATLWFAGLAVSKAPLAQGVTRVVCIPGRMITLYHALMMGAMVWMAVVMAGWAASDSAKAPDHGDMAGMDMTGMDMPGMHHGNSSGTAPHAAQPMWTSIADVAIGVLFLGAALWWLRRYFLLRKAPGRSPIVESELLWEVGMALGMGVMTLGMS